MAYKEWTKIAWPYNPAITFECQAKTIKYYTFILHKRFIYIKDTPNFLGEWDESETFAFTVQGQMSGICPDSITTWDAAKQFCEQYKV